MRLLFDENLSPRLVVQLSGLFPGSVHVRDVGMASADDSIVWAFAREHGYCIISKDSDFRSRSLVMGAPPKVISLHVGNCSTSQMIEVVRRHAAYILAFGEDPSASILELP